MRKPTVVAAALLLSCAAPLAAQSVKLEFRDGKVDLHAQNAPVRVILNEWGRLGRTQIVNGDRVPGAPVTLELVGVYERDAIEILLRGVSGYLVNPRAGAAAGASGFDRIFILPTSSAPRANAPAAPFSPRTIPPPARPPIPQAPEEDPAAEDDPAVPISNGRAGPLQNPRAAVRERLGQILELDPDDVELPPEPPPSSSPGNPFSVAPGSVRPGVIAPIAPPTQRPPEARPEQ